MEASDEAAGFGSVLRRRRGQSMGLHRAGFDVVGVDINHQAREAVPVSVHLQGDALSPPVDLAAFDFIWASPPCQHASRALAGYPEIRAKHPKLIEPTRDMLESCGVPYVIENVVNAAVRPDVVLDGSIFGLPLVRTRLFEVSWLHPTICVERRA